MATNPKHSIELLEQLVQLGFTDEAFARLHHFRLKRRKATITPHRRYCEKTDSFVPDGTNELVQRRLDYVLNAVRATGLRSAQPDQFSAWADEAFREIPPNEAPHPPRSRD
jgi:hypothetical protein